MTVESISVLVAREMDMRKTTLIVVLFEESHSLRREKQDAQYHLIYTTLAWCRGKIQKFWYMEKSILCTPNFANFISIGNEGKEEVMTSAVVDLLK